MIIVEAMKNDLKDNYASIGNGFPKAFIEENGSQRTERMSMVSGKHLDPYILWDLEPA